MFWTLMGLLMIVVGVAIAVSSLALLLTITYLAWTDPEKYDRFRENVVHKLPGYDLFPNLVRSPLTRRQLWGTRIAGTLVLLFLIAQVILMILVSSQ